VDHEDLGETERDREHPPRDRRSGELRTLMGEPIQADDRDGGE
jgi:hypothetical protein